MAAFKSNTTEAIKHYNGKQNADSFDAISYLNNYADLSAFGNDQTLATKQRF